MASAPPPPSSPSSPSPPSSVAERGARFPSTAALVVGIALFVAVGTPLVAYVWEALNRLFAGHADARQLAIGAVAAVALVALLLFLARTVQRWDASAAARAALTDESDRAGASARARRRFTP